MPALTFGNSEDEGVLSDINTTPLVDVMLVLLIIFLITIPVVTNTINVELPHEKNQVRVAKPDNITLSVDKDGHIFWGSEPVSNTNELTNRLQQLVQKDPRSEVEIRGDTNARYEFIGRVIYASQRAGIVNINFVTEPGAKQ